jgi:poly(3-hydroxybutyrate) depolymerase
MYWRIGPQSLYTVFLWPALAAASASEMASFVAAQMLTLSQAADNTPTCQEPKGITPSRIALELNTVHLRDFSTGTTGIPALLCTPLALHGGALADLAVGHSLIAALLDAGTDRLFLADWRSAGAEMRFLGIDDYLADLNVLVDHAGGLVDLVGLCQGGWLALVYAARFPTKVRKLVIAGAPVDTTAQPSTLSAMAMATPPAVFKGFVTAGEGRVLGRHMAKFWGAAEPHASDIQRSLQTSEPVGSTAFARLETRFNEWNSWTIDLPGTYFLEAMERLYKRNALADGSFVALGQAVDLAQLHTPMYLLAGDDDDVVAPQQLFALARLAGTPSESVRCELVPSDHLGLFMGKRVLEERWPAIARWMKERSPPSVERLSA